MVIKRGIMMNSCLQPFWEKVIPLINELADNATDDITKNKNTFKIYNMIDELNPKEKIEHLKIFKKAFSNHPISYKKIVEYAELAARKSDSCGLCYSCSNCSQNEYEKIINKELVFNEIPVDLIPYFSAKSQISYYNSFFSFQKEWNNKSDSLICLKGFSSSTPILHSAVFNNQCSGGGFFLNIHGIGIVIDPGVGYVDMMHKHGISITDIDIVIITHNHADHCADAPLIASLNYDYNRYYRQNEKLYALFKKDTHPPKHCIQWFLDDSSSIILRDSIKSDDVLLLKDFTEQEHDLSFGENELKLSSIQTEHDSNIPSYGIKITSNYAGERYSVGYTSDTCYLETLPSFFDSLEILIFNISDIYKEDIQYGKQKRTHLGYSGSMELIKNILNKPKLAVVSEFCCTNGDFRLRITKKLNEDSKHCDYKVRIIPGEIGLKISLKDYCCQCTQCKRMVPINDIVITNPCIEYGPIQYVCEKCTTSDC